MNYLAHTLVSPHIHSGESYVDLLVIFTIFVVVAVIGLYIASTKESGDS